MPNTNKNTDQEPENSPKDQPEDQPENLSATQQAGQPEPEGGADHGDGVDSVDEENSAPVDMDSSDETHEKPQQSPEEIIQNLETEVVDLNDRLLRAVAETENVRRRAQRDKEDMAKYAISNFSRDMLAVADNLRRALDSVDEETRKSHGAVENAMIGVEMTERELLAAFQRTGIKRMEPIGQKFDPNIHEAMFEYEDTDKPAGSVGQVVEAGYMLHSRALRPAKVGVTKGGPKFGVTSKVEAETKSETNTAEPTADGKGYDKKAESADEHVGEHINEEF